MTTEASNLEKDDGLVSSVELISLTCVTGTFPHRTVTLTLGLGGNKIGVDRKHQTATFSVRDGGPVHAAVQAIRQLVPNELEIVSCNTQSMKSGSDAAALATVITQAGNFEFRGVGHDTDTTMATIKGYIAALNNHLAHLFISDRAAELARVAGWSPEDSHANLSDRRPY